MFRVVPFQFEAVALCCFGNDGSDLVCNTFPDEVESAVIGSDCVQGQFLAGVGEQYCSNPRDYHNRLRVGEGYFLNRSNLFLTTFTHRGESTKAVGRERAII